MAQTAQQKADVARELARRLYATATANLNHDNLVAALPEPFKSNSTAQQKALVLMLWVMKETGII